MDSNFAKNSDWVSVVPGVGEMRLRRYMSAEIQPMMAIQAIQVKAGTFMPPGGFFLLPPSPFF